MENNNYFADGYELDWDGSIEKDSPEFIILPDGDYKFTVTNIERGRFNGSDKMPPCNKVTVHMKVSSAEGDVTLRKDLFLHSKCEGILCAFFTCIGQRKHGEKISMNWNAVPGSNGRASVTTREYNGKKYNEVKRFLEPSNAASSGGWNSTQNNGGYIPGKF